MFEIYDDHPIYLMEELVQQKTKEFLGQFGINYFQYAKCYYDGSFSMLANQLDLVRLFLTFENEPLIYSYFEEELKNKQQFYFFWDESLPSKPVSIVKQQFNFHHGLTLVRRHKNHYDLVAFALEKPHANPYGYFMTILHKLEWFIAEFEINQVDEFRLVDNQRVYLPREKQDVNCQNLCIKKGRIEFEVNDYSTHITLKELYCIKGLTQGLSYKEVARRLDISPKTVETYINRVIHRTGLDYRNQIFISM